MDESTNIIKKRMSRQTIIKLIIKNINNLDPFVIFVPN